MTASVLAIRAQGADAAQAAQGAQAVRALAAGDHGGNEAATNHAAPSAAATTPPADTASDPLVTLRGAGVRFGPVQALRAIDLELRRGDRLALVGPNGSGKTTLLRLLHGVQPASEGARTVHAPAPGAPAWRGAMVFQRPFLLELGVRLNLLVALWLAGVPARERAGRCEAALRRVGLAGLAKRRARALSGGQQQRLALARAWATEPGVLFLDEPTAHLDPGAKREVEAVVADIAAEGTTIVLSTHNLGQAKRLASRVACLDEGRLVADLPVERFFADDDTALPEAARRFLKGDLPWTR